MGKHYIRFDEIEDVLASVDLLALIAPLARLTPSYWKWLIIGAQNGLQGAMVNALGDTMGVNVLGKKSARLVLDWHNNPSGPYPKERLAEFEVLLERCRKETPNGRLLELTATEEKDVLRLHNEFRNSFSHFKRMSWSIEKAGLPRIVGTAIDCIEKLMTRYEVDVKMSGNRKRRFAKGIKSARNSLKLL